MQNKVQNMKPTLLRSVPALSGKSRKERAVIIRPLYETDSKLKFYRKLWIGTFLFIGPFIASLYGSHVSITTAILTGALIGIIIPTLIQLFCVNPRLKEILEVKTSNSR